MAPKLCNVCNIRRPKTGTKGTEVSPYSDMCNYCFEEGGMENQHSDHAHDAIKEIIEHAGDAQLSDTDRSELEFMKNCWFCHPEKNLARTPAATRTGHTNTAPKGPAHSHAGCTHDRTPKARATCRAANTWVDGKGWIAKK